MAKADSSLTIEFYPHNFTWLNSQISKVPIPLNTFVVLMAFERIPTFKKFEIGKIVSHEEMIWREESQVGEGFFEWYIGTDKIGNRTGRWFMTVMALNIPPAESCNVNSYSITACSIELNSNLNLKNDIKTRLNNGTLNRNDVTGFKPKERDYSIYSLRTYTSGCYFYSRQAKAWIADNTQVDISYAQAKIIF